MSAGTHRAGTRRSRRTFHSALGVLLVAIVVGGQTLGFGAWLSTGPVTGIRQVQAATLISPAAPIATQVVGGKTVRLTWAAVTNATSYEVRYYPTASGGTPTLACGASGLTCVDPTNRLGANNWYSVVARVGTQWIAESARVRYTADEATTVVISALGSDTGSSMIDFITKTALNTLTGTSEANATVVITRGADQIATATANGSGAWTSSPFSLAEGLQDLKATATDAFANSANVTKTGVRLDTTAPATTKTVSACVAGNGSWCKNASRTISFASTDTDGSGIGSTEVQNGSLIWTAYTGMITVGQVNGRVVTFRATDVAGNESLFQTETFYNDNVAPTLVVTTPNGTNCSERSGCGTASDAVSGMFDGTAAASVKWRLQKSPLIGSQCRTATTWSASCPQPWQNAQGTLPSWQSTFTYENDLLTSYTLSVMATDAAGNVALGSSSAW